MLFENLLLPQETIRKMSNIVGFDVNNEDTLCFAINCLVSDCSEEETIGERIKDIRKKRGISQKELGELSDTSETTIKQYELGKRQPRIEQLKAISKALNTPLIVLINGSER